MISISFSPINELIHSNDPRNNQSLPLWFWREQSWLSAAADYRLSTAIYILPLRIVPPKN